VTLPAARLDVWSGRASQEGFIEVAVSGLASMMAWTAPLFRAGG
jgi:hypothetical protein